MNFGDSSVPYSERRMVLLALFMLALLTGVAFVSRPMTPIDETRYISVAWEMWLRGDFLVPFKNGATYSHKPPLMIWMYQAGWAVFGVNEWWPRLVSPLFAAASVLLTMGLSRRLWPQRYGIGGPAALILVSCSLWTIFSTAAMFDVILAFFTLLGMHGTLKAAEGSTLRGVALLSLAIGLGVLAKGPVILLHVLPVALLAPWWKRNLHWLSWFGLVFLAVLLGAAIALMWAVPAGIAGGEAYRKAIFWGQTADRMVESFAHRRPLWWYLPLLPALFFPWLLWPGLWGALRRFLSYGMDRGGRFCLAWFLPVLIAFSFISGKQPHYLIPIFPAFALLASRAMADDRRVRGLWLPGLTVLASGGGLFALAMGWVKFPYAGLSDPPAIWPGALLMLLAMVAYLMGRRLDKPVAFMAIFGVMVSAFVQLTFLRPMYPAYDVRPMAQAISKLQSSGHVVANYGEYHNQYHFAGRLSQPLPVQDNVDELKAWLNAHPDDYALVYTKDLTRLQGVKVVATQPYLAVQAVLLDAPTALKVVAIPGALSKP